METNKSYSIGNDMKFTDMVAINPEFTLAKCYVQAVGKNRNYTNMEKEAINNALPTLDFIPVVAHCFKDAEGEYRLGGHDYTIDEDYNIVSETVPFGVVKPNTANYEMVEEYGKEVEYLTCEVVLWTGRYPKLMETAYSDEIMWNQSMEINVNQYRPLEEDSNYTDILDFSYSALCLLNKSDDKAENVEPCFINARVETFSSDEFLAKLAELKNEIFNLKEEGETMTENETPVSEEMVTEQPVENTNFSNEAEPTSISNYQLTANQKRDAIRSVLSLQNVCTADFECWHYLCDYDDNYIYVERDTYNSQGYKEEKGAFSYSVTENDEISLGEFETRKVMWLTQAECDTIEEMRDQISSYEAQIAELEPYRNSALQAEKESVFAKYEGKIGGMSEFVALKEKIADYTAEELNRECLMLVGKFAMEQTPVEETETITFSVSEPKEEKTNTKYGDLYNQYRSK